jgi:hypothetical protein
MPVYPGSRYEGVARSALVRTNGQVDAILHSRERVKAEELGEGDVIHEFEVTEELDLLAFDFGGKTRLFWLIADVNEIIDPFNIPVGTKLIIPPEEDFSKR